MKGKMMVSEPAAHTVAWVWLHLRMGVPWHSVASRRFVERPCLDYLMLAGVSEMAPALAQRPQ